MGKQKKTLFGDTLIEVMLAVGIFSLVSIGVVSVMTMSSGKNENTLLTTMARAEIDSQAEAIRFIHDAYVSERDNGEYTKIWNQIKDLSSSSGNINIAVPETCDSVYNDSTLENSLSQLHAFIVNTRKMGNSNGTGDGTIVKFSTSSSKFHSASTYPRLIWNSDNSKNDELSESTSATSLYRAEGIYDIVRASKTGTGSTYYDFYIRACWYSNGETVPNTISTVVRLYDPK